jgi:hypothetical protein
MSRAQQEQRRRKLKARADDAVNDPIYSADLRLAALAADAQYDPEKAKELEELMERGE